MIQNQSNWYIQVDSANNDIYTTLIANSQYQNLGFTPTTFIRRVPDARDLKDRIYRFRYVLDKDAFLYLENLLLVSLYNLDHQKQTHQHMIKHITSMR
ncbi:MAG: hypothetical protein CM15mV13_0620 [uncultured marine virus]|nr:MAG: hypothetical protein CM15mV13_0620 [uncultured marine virus]